MVELVLDFGAAQSAVERRGLFLNILDGYGLSKDDSLAENEKCRNKIISLLATNFGRKPLEKATCSDTQISGKDIEDVLTGMFESERCAQIRRIQDLACQKKITPDDILAKWDYEWMDDNMIPILDFFLRTGKLDANGTYEYERESGTFLEDAVQNLRVPLTALFLKHGASVGVPFFLETIHFVYHLRNPETLAHGKEIISLLTKHYPGLENERCQEYTKTENREIDKVPHLTLRALIDAYEARIQVENEMARNFIKIVWGDIDPKDAISLLQQDQAAGKGL
jgi:hypothetical protein